MESLLLFARGGKLPLLPLAFPREGSLFCEQLVLHVALLLRAHGHDLGLGMHADADLLRALAGDVNFVARAGDRRGDALVLPCDCFEVMNLIEHILERLGRQDHLHERGITRLVDVDHAQVQLTHDVRVLTSEEVEALGLEVEQLVEPVEPPLVQRKILFEDRKLLRNVADLAFQGTNLGRDVRDLVREAGFLGARGSDARLDRAELAAVVAGSRRSQNEPGNEDEGQSAGHERRFGGAPDVPAAGKAPQAPVRPSSGS